MGEIVPYDDRNGVIWFDGEFVDWRDARVHLLTHGLHYGSCVFEGERAYGGAIFKSLEHSERLLRSGELLGFEVPFDATTIEAAKRDTLDRMGHENAYLRPVAWRGSEQMGVSGDQNRIHLAIAAWVWGDYFADKMKGIRLAISDWRRPAPDTAPVKAKAAGLYMICTLSKHAAEAKGYADALMFDYKGRVAECTGAHVFFVKDGALHTPTADCLLDGITQAAVKDIARARNIPVRERDIDPSELTSFDECFIVGTAAEVTPVSEIQGVTYSPGDVTAAIVQDYDAVVRGQLALQPAE